ncbi:hypothetical protein O1M54_29325 [Streptomyces diastatochromogenes]|nr:hypothetical protein [Streptomyces diastatochromogenes]
MSATALSGWDTSAATVLKGLTAAEEGAGTRATAQADPFGWSTLGASGVAVVLGLVGVLLSLLVSVLVGRGLIVELLDLRNDALEVAGRRLPQAMRKLHAGQGVDIDAEAPMRRLVGDELAQVGTALTAVQRAALKAASNAPNCSAASPACTSASRAAARCCCTGSSTCSTACSGASTTPRSCRTCTASTTSPRACGATPRAC